MGGMTWNLKPAFEYLRHAKLVWAKCSKCSRGSMWSKLPAKCKALMCGGKVEK